jgi:probable phosphoglycerate mutase
MTSDRPIASLGSLAARLMALDHCLLLARHGQTEWNLQDRMTTDTDVPLSALGEGQARGLGEALRGAVFDGVWVSPLKRAGATAELALGAAAAGGGAVTIDARLTEPSAGPFEGIAFADLRHGPDGALRAAFARYADERSPVYPDGAEPVPAAAARARDFLDAIAATPGRHLAVSHGALIRIMVCALVGLDPLRFRRLHIGNCRAALLGFDPEQLVGLNL